MKLEGITLPTISLPHYYWHYERKSEKMADILLHVQCLFHGMHCVYENHAGCERGYFIKHNGELVTLPKKDSQNIKLYLPDVVLYDEATNYILLIEGKKISTLKTGLREIRRYDSIEQEYIYPEYGNVSIKRYLSIFGGEKQNLPHQEVLFYLTDSGRIIINANAPACIRNCFSANEASYM